MRDGRVVVRIFKVDCYGGEDVGGGYVGGVESREAVVGVLEVGDPWSKGLHFDGLGGPMETEAS